MGKALMNQHPKTLLISGVCLSILKLVFAINPYAVHIQRKLRVHGPFSLGFMLYMRHAQMLTPLQ